MRTRSSRFRGADLGKPQRSARWWSTCAAGPPSAPGTAPPPACRKPASRSAPLRSRGRRARRRPAGRGGARAPCAHGTTPATAAPPGPVDCGTAEPPLDADAVLQSFSGEVPVFPLPSLVLLPDTIRAVLLIFEDRYRRMTADALEGERLIAMALLKPAGDAVQRRARVPRARVRRLHRQPRAPRRRPLQAAPLRALPRRGGRGDAGRALPQGARQGARRRGARRGRPAKSDQRLHQALDRHARPPRPRGPHPPDRAAGPRTVGRRGAPRPRRRPGGRVEPEERYQVLAETDVLRRLDLVLEVLERKARSGPQTLPARVMLN